MKYYYPWILGTIVTSIWSCAMDTHYRGVGMPNDKHVKSSYRRSVSCAECLTLNVIQDAVDTIQSELLLSGVCKGGESIEIWIRAQADHERTLDLIYYVPDILHIYREAFVQRDETVLLADSLDYGFVETRYSTHHATDDDLRDLPSYPTHVVAKLAGTLSATQEAAQHERERRIEESYLGP